MAPPRPRHGEGLETNRPGFVRAAEVLVPGIAAVLLAAGGSTRMGRPKQLLAVDGRSLLRRAAEAAVAAGLSPVVTVLGRDADRMAEELVGLPVTTTANADWKRGIGTSIRHGVRRALESAPDAAAVAILLADQPLVGPAELRRLLAQFAEAGKPVCASAYAGTIGPPVVVGPAYFDALLALPDDRGAKAIWAGDPRAVAECPCEAAAFDVDTPTDFARLADRLAPDRLASGGGNA